MKFNFIYITAFAMLVSFNSFAQFGSIKSKAKEVIKTDDTKNPAKITTTTDPKKIVNQVNKQALWPQGNIYRVTPAAFFIPIHEKYVGKIVFSRQKLKADATNENALTNSFAVGDFMYARVFTKEPLKNYCLYDGNNGPYDNNFYSGFAFFYFDDSKQPNAQIGFTHTGESKNWTTWQMFLNATGDDAKLNNESFIKAVNDLPVGTHKVRVEVIAGSTGRMAIELAATGEFTLIKAQGAKLKLGASWADYKSKMTNPTLDKQILEVVSGFASRQGWSETFSKVKITDADWKVYTNEWTGVPISRSINAIVYAKWPDGHCTAQEVSVKQEYVVGSGVYSKVVQYEGVGNQYKIDCE